MYKQLSVIAFPQPQYEFRRSHYGSILVLKFFGVLLQSIVPPSWYM